MMFCNRMRILPGWSSGVTIVFWNATIFHPSGIRLAIRVGRACNTGGKPTRATLSSASNRPHPLGPSACVDFMLREKVLVLKP